MALLVEEKCKIFFGLVAQLTESSQDGGFTERELAEALNKDPKQSVLFTTYYNLEDYIESNLFLERLGKRGQRFYLTEKGKKFAEEKVSISY